MKRSLRSWLWRVPIDQEVEEELAFHLEMRRREGKPIDPTDVDRVRQACVEIARRRDREMRLTTWLEERRTDIRFALRQLRRAPGFAAVAVLTLALGIGANSAIFALADATFFRSLPFTHPADRLVMIWESRGPGTFISATPADYADWSDQNRTLAATAAVSLGLARMTGPDGVPEQPLAQSVTVRFFDVLGVTPLVGRTFRESDLTPSPQAVVVGEAFWRSRLAADPAAVGGSLVINGRPLDLVGVVPASFELVPPVGLTGGPPPQIWILFETALAGSPAARLSHNLTIVGRMKPGASLDHAQADLDVIAARLAEQFPDSNNGHGVTVQPLRAALIGPQVRLTSLLLVGVVGFVLLMCCANVASLLLAQATGRTRELAVRAALGAGRGRVVAQLLTESLVLASIGGVVAVGITAALIAAAPSFVPPGVLPSAVGLSFDGRVAAVCALTALAIGVLFGSAPAWQSTRGRLADAGSSEGRITRRGGWLRSGLVSVQVAAAVLVLCGAGLLLRTLITLQNMDSGFRASEVLTGMINLPVPNRVTGTTSPYPTADAVLRFYDAVEREVRAIPGVRRVAWGSIVPLDGTFFGQPFAIAGDPPTPMASRANAAYHMVSPAYFETLDIPIVAGRGFAAADTAAAPAVCLVSEAFVEQHLNGRNPIGMRLELGRMRHVSEAPAVEPTVEIVGVVRQVKAAVAETTPLAQVYVPLAQNRWWIASLVVRPDRGDAAALAGPVRAAVARVDREVAVARVRTMATIADDATARQRFRAALVGAFAALALLLAMVGVFGVLSQLVQQRMREFGVRIALGASRQNVIGLVLGHATRITVAGVIVGLALAAMLGRLLATLIYPVQPLDPVTFAVVPVIAALTATAACLAPAWRATRVDPATAFRDE